jgi:hypothetical protein
MGAGQSHFFYQFFFFSRRAESLHQTMSKAQFSLRLQRG